MTMETNANAARPARRWRKGGLIALGLGAVLAGAAGIAWAAGVGPGMIGHGFCRPGMGRDFVEFRIHKALGQVNATDAQEQQIMAIVDGLFAKHQAMAAAHEQMHNQLLAALTGATVDRAAIEAVRAERDHPHRGGVEGPRQGGRRHRRGAHPGPAAAARGARHAAPAAVAIMATSRRRRPLGRRRPPAGSRTLSEQVLIIDDDRKLTAMLVGVPAAARHLRRQRRATRRADSRCSPAGRSTPSSSTSCSPTSTGSRCAVACARPRTCRC